MPESIKSNSEFRRAYKKGKYKSGRYVTVYAFANRTDINRIGIVTGKKVGNAVQRNRMRRLIREIYHHNVQDKVSGYDLVFFVKPSHRVAANTARKLRAEYIPTFDELKEDILQSLSMMKMM